MVLNRLGILFATAVLATAVLGFAFAGCKKSDSPPPPASRAVSEAGSEISHLHWLGRKRLAAETNAAHFMRIWNLPESAQLGAQTLDKFSLAPWRLLKGDAATKGAPSALLRPLLDDVVEEESYLEIRHAANQPGQFAFAIRLGEARARLWETNLAVVLESFTGSRPTAATGDRRGWSLKKLDAPKLIELSRVGDWTIVSAAQDAATLPVEFAERIKRDRTPFAVTTNLWIDAALDLRRISGALSLGWNLPTNMPQISLAIVGDGQNVRTRGELNFPESLQMELDAWNIPTNLVHDPLIGFSAARGIRPLLKSLKLWDESKLGTPPNQASIWAQAGGSMLHFLALPSADASNQVSLLGESVLREVNPMLVSNRLGKFEMLPASNNLRWRGLPLISPTLDDVKTEGGPFIFASCFLRPLTNKPIPNGLLQQINASPNLVYYDWEITQPLVTGWLQLGQAIRLLSGRPRLNTNQPAVRWLAALAPEVGNSVTAIRMVGPGRFSVTRNSSVGLTGVELNLLADWLESPVFPKGLFTLDSSPATKPGNQLPSSPTEKK